MSLIGIIWYRMKSRTAIDPLKSRADKNYFANYDSADVVQYGAQIITTN